MPRGFVGRPAHKYLGQVQEAHTQAIAAGRQAVPQHMPNNTNLRERQLPFGPEDAHVGSFTTGRRNSSNIVVNQQEYEDICRQVDKADDQIGECLYRIAAEIEALCGSAFVLPAATPRCQNISNEVKHTLGQFRSFTDDIVIQTRRFTQAITEIGG